MQYLRRRIRAVATIRTGVGCAQRTVLPLPELGYYTNPISPPIATNALIPIIETLLLSRDITTASNSSIRLNNGVYKINFSAVAVPSVNGESEITLYINNSPSNIVSTATSVAGGKNPLSAVGIVVIITNSTQIALVNTGSNQHTFKNVNLTVQKLA